MKWQSNYRARESQKRQWLAGLMERGTVVFDDMPEFGLKKTDYRAVREKVLLVKMVVAEEELKVLMEERGAALAVANDST
jgi:hypothetical protein